MAALPAHIAPGVRVKPLLNQVKSLARHPKTLTTMAAVPTTRLARALQLRSQQQVSPHLRLKLTQS